MWVVIIDHLHLSKLKIKIMKLEAIKGYYTEENVVFLTGDIVELVLMGEGNIMLEGVAGWCKGFIMEFDPETVATHFKVIGLTYTL